MRVAIQMMVNCRNVYSTLIREFSITDIPVIFRLSTKDLRTIVMGVNDFTLKKDWAEVEDLNNN